MNPNDTTLRVNAALRQAVEHFSNDLKSLRTGRANAAMLDGVMVEAYGTPMPLNQLSTITTPEAQLIQISPFDINNLQAIVTAIRNNQNLGLNPTDDGRIVRIQIPPLTEERRRDIVKQLGQKQEEAMVRLRIVRKDALDEIKKYKEIGEDDAKRLEKQVDEAMSRAKAEVENAAAHKERELMSL